MMNTAHMVHCGVYVFYAQATSAYRSRVMATVNAIALIFAVFVIAYIIYALTR